MSTTADLDAAYRLLVGHGVAVDPAEIRAAQARLAPPTPTCFKCGASEDDNYAAGYGPLTDITVTVADGEEGAATERRLVCNDDLIVLTDALVALGFGSHRHGGINYLEDTACPGTSNPDACTTPAAADH